MISKIVNKKLLSFFESKSTTDISLVKRRQTLWVQWYWKKEGFVIKVL
jgi:hypothetical protein